MKCLRSSLVAMMGSLLLLSTALAQVKTSLLARSPANETWIRFTSRTDKFEVLMPAAPTFKQETFVLGAQQLLLSYYGARRGESDYAVVTLAGFNGAGWQVPHMLMLELYCRSNALGNTSQGAQSSSSFKATFQKDISLGGYAGKQFSLKSDDRVGEWRIYAVNKTFYAIAGSSQSRSTYALRRFFDSFSLSENNSIVATATTEEKKVSNPTVRWLIILQTFSRNERARAVRRMNLLQGQGYDTQVISTDSYANLKPGLLALAMGPFSKRAAEERLGELRLVAPQAYIKAGW